MYRVTTRRAPVYACAPQSFVITLFVHTMRTAVPKTIGTRTCSRAAFSPSWIIHSCRYVTDEIDGVSGFILGRAVADVQSAKRRYVTLVYNFYYLICTCLTRFKLCRSIFNIVRLVRYNYYVTAWRTKNPWRFVRIIFVFFFSQKWAW